MVTPDPEQSSGPVLQVRGLRRTFQAATAPVRALRGVDLDVASGELVALMGPSGSGKSSLLKLIAGLDRPDGGTVLVADTPLDGLDEDGLARMRRRHIGFVFQFFELLDDMTALENVALAAVLGGLRRRQAEDRAISMLDLVGLGDRASAPPGVLSGGERQRLALARALANAPSLLLADEPTGALDTAGTDEILELLRRLHADGQTVLLVTHDLRVAEIADRVLHLVDGRIQEVAAPAAMSV
jgi:putative ABC transport system ATP-binding protein